MAIIDGTNGNDTLNGTSVGDTISGLAGDDELHGGDGSDGLSGNEGNDTLDGGAGNDVLDGGEGDDIVFGGADRDQLNDTDGNNSLYGGDGDDSLMADGIINVAAQLYFTNHLYGDAGDDGLLLFNSNGSLSGGDGDDFLGTWTGTTTLDGGAGNDILSLGRTFFLDQPEGVQTAIGGLGADIFELHANSNFAELDRLMDFNSAEGDRISLAGVENGKVVDAFAWNGGLPVMFGGELNAALLSNGSVLPDSGADSDVLQVWYARQGSVTYVVADANADGTFDTDDFVVELAGEYVLTAADFVVGTFSVGTPGDDVLSGGDQDDELNGFGGNDVIIGEGGADTLNGGDGDDTLYSWIVSPPWESPFFLNNPDYVGPVIDQLGDVDTLIGGAGVDRIYAGFGDIIDGGADLADLLISLRGATAGVTVDFGNLDSGGTLTIGGNTISNIRSVLWIEGSEFDDTITGSDQGGGFGGNNAPMFGMDGNDHLIAGINTGNIYGGDGNDTIEVHQNYLGGPGYNGVYFGDAGDDIIAVTGDSVSYPLATALGGDGDDHLTLAGWIYGGAGNDTINVALNLSYPTEAHGDEGNDTIIDSQSSDTLFGGAGADIIEGNEGNDVIGSAGMDSSGPGWEGWDPVDRGSEHDELSGGGGDDTILAGYGDDADGGAGFNGLSLSLIGAASGVTLNVADLTGAGPHMVGGGTIQNFQYVTHIYGTSFADNLTMSQSLIAYGMGGNDTIAGTAGEDEIHGGAGADIINAGGGNDTIYIDDLGDVGAGEQINGGDGIDTLMVVGIPGLPEGSYYDLSGATLTGIERLASEGPAELGVTASQLSSITTLAAGHLYFTASGAISLNGITAEGSTSFLLNPAGNQLDLSGFTPDGFCIVAGGAGNDIITGSTSSDSIYANEGEDRIDGGAGFDDLHGFLGDDTLTGGADADILSGGSGRDTFSDTKAGLDGDTITDFGAGDRIVITDASLAGFTFHVSGDTLTYTGGSLTLSEPLSGTLVARAAAGGGVELSIAAAVDTPLPSSADFNGDGFTDILWRNEEGALSQWLGQDGGTFAYNPNAAYQLSTEWSIAGFGDFNNDDRDDVLWRNDDGAVMEWLGQTNGTFAWNPNVALQLGNDWHLAGIADFNGDQHADVLWRNDAGALSQWLGQANGSFAYNPNAALQLGAEWSIAGTGDFNGDSRADVLWRNHEGALSQWLGQANGSFAYNPSAAYQLGTEWQVAAIGDFNGDNRADILWRNLDGAMSQWLAQPGGTFAYNPGAAYSLPTNWELATSGDFNGDNRDDLIWRNEAGALSEWLAQSGGTFAYNGNAAYQLSTNWHLQPDSVPFF